MNILFEFITAQAKYGAGEYLRRVFFELLETIKENDKENIHVFVVYNSKMGIAYEDLRSDVISKKYNIKYLDCKNIGIDAIVEKYKIDRFFIACGQFLEDNTEIENIRCETICVIHDLNGEEKYNNQIFLYQNLINPNNTQSSKGMSLKWKILKSIPLLNRAIPFDLFSSMYVRGRGNEFYKRHLIRLKPIINLIKRNNNVRLITVSEYSKASIHYNYNIPLDCIEVLYSPERKEVSSISLKNAELKHLIGSKKKYYVMLSANRVEKNPYKLIHAFSRFSDENNDAYLVTLSYPQKEFRNHIPLEFLDDSDLLALIKNCYALIYPTFFEGFGYPPLEAMHYGKPVLCSNVTSIPEIFEDAPIYFTPIYETSIFQALNKLTDSNYDDYCTKSKKQYQKIRNRQESDLKKLIDLLCQDI